MLTYPSILKNGQTKALMSDKNIGAKFLFSLYVGQRYFVYRYYKTGPYNFLHLYKQIKTPKLIT